MTPDRAALADEIDKWLAAQLAGPMSRDLLKRAAAALRDTAGAGGETTLVVRLAEGIGEQGSSEHDPLEWFAEYLDDYVRENGAEPGTAYMQEAAVVLRAVVEARAWKTTDSDGRAARSDASHGPGECARIDTEHPGEHVVAPVRCWLSNRSDACPHKPHLHGVHPSISTAAFWCDGGVPGYAPFGARYIDEPLAADNANLRAEVERLHASSVVAQPGSEPVTYRTHSEDASDVQLHVGREWIAVRGGDSGIPLMPQMPAHVQMRWRDDQGRRCSRLFAEVSRDDDADAIATALNASVVAQETADRAALVAVVRRALREPACTEFTITDAVLAALRAAPGVAQETADASGPNKPDFPKDADGDCGWADFVRVYGAAPDDHFGCVDAYFRRYPNADARTAFSVGVTCGENARLVEMRRARAS